MATMTITVTAPQAARAATAIGKRLGLGRDATLEECRLYVIEELRKVVLFEERRALEVAITASPFDPT